jgi:type VI secretion system protein ImpG
MSRELWPFYEQELAFLRTQAREFGREYAREAGFLRLEESGRSVDPHVERMVQAFALLAARIRLKLDDDFPELTDALLGILYPHYLAPIPSLLIAQLEPGPGADLVNGLTLPRHTPFRTTPVNGVECEYRTVYPLRLWPVKVAEAQLKGPPYLDLKDVMPRLPAGTKARLRLRFDLTAGAKFAEVALGRPAASGRPSALRLFLDADGPLSATLYELLFNNVAGVAFRDPGGEKVVEVPPHEAIRPVGFTTRRARETDPAADDADESVLPYPDQSFPGYRLLTEFFAYRDKFLFLDLGGWDVARAAGLLTKGSVEVHVFLNQGIGPDLERAVSARTLRPGCAPLVNLFKKGSTEGFTITQQKYEYTLVPDHENLDGYEIYSVDAVYHRTPSGEEKRYEPFYSFRHQDRDRGHRYWYARRRPSLRRGDRGTEVDVHFVDLDFNPKLPAENIALAAVTCLNRDLPARLAENMGSWALRPVGMVVPAAMNVIRSPTPTLRPMQKRIDRLGDEDFSRKMTYWRVVSHLALNHLSVADPDEGRQALTEYLSLYDFADDQHPEMREVAQQIRDGVLKVGSRRDVAFVPGDTVGGYARGMEVALELDEEKYVGIGAFLFAAVLERFFATYASINSFTRLAYRTRQRGPIKTWDARAGDRPLV